MLDAGQEVLVHEGNYVTLPIFKTPDNKPIPVITISTSLHSCKPSADCIRHHVAEITKQAFHDAVFDVPVTEGEEAIYLARLNRREDSINNVVSCLNSCN